MFFLFVILIQLLHKDNSLFLQRALYEVMAILPSKLIKVKSIFNLSHTFLILCHAPE